MNPKTAREAEAAEFGRKLRGFGIRTLHIILNDNEDNLLISTVY